MGRCGNARLGIGRTTGVVGRVCRAVKEGAVIHELDGYFTRGRRTREGCQTRWRDWERRSRRGNGFEDDNLPHDRETAEIELAGLAATAAMTANRLGAGNVRDIIIEADDLTYIASLITSGYFAVLGISSNGNLGRARFAVRQMVQRLQSEL